MREVYGGLGIGGHRDDTECRFGVGRAAKIDRVEIRWPDRANTVQSFADVAPNRCYALTPGGALKRPADAEGGPPIRFPGPENPVFLYEVSRRQLLRRFLWTIAIVGALVHFAFAVTVLLEVASGWNGGGAWRAVGSILALVSDHAIGAGVAFFALPPLLATAFAEERAGGLGEMLVLSGYPRRRILEGRAWARIEPLFWLTCAHLVLMTPAMLAFEAWQTHHRVWKLLPLGTVAGVAMIASAFAVPASVSLWAGMRFARTGVAVGISYGVILLLAAVAYAVVGGLAWLVGGGIFRGPDSDDIATAAACLFFTILAGASLVGAWRVWRGATGRLDEALTRTVSDGGAAGEGIAPGAPGLPRRTD